MQEVCEAQRAPEGDAGREPKGVAGQVQREEQRQVLHHRMQGGKRRYERSVWTRKAVGRLSFVGFPLVYSVRHQVSSKVVRPILQLLQLQQELLRNINRTSQTDLTAQSVLHSILTGSIVQHSVAFVGQMLIALNFQPASSTNRSPSWATAST